MALGHACGMPPTGANIAVLLFKTWLAAGSTYTLQPFVVGLGVGIMVGLGAVLLFRCCMQFVVAVVVVAVVLFLLVSIYVRLRVLVCSVIVEARRSVTRRGCRPPAPKLLCYY